MIKIKKELLEQIERSMEQDPEYVPKILKRLDPEIKGVMYALLESGFNSAKLFITFYKALENGLENFDMPDELDVTAYFEEIKEHNPIIARSVIECVNLGKNQLWVLIILYRIFESELEVRSLI